AGLINVVLRRNAAGTRAYVRAEHLADIGADSNDVYVEHVSETQDKRGWFSVGAGWSTQGAVQAWQHNTLTYGRQRAAENNPSLLATEIPPLGAQRNVRSVSGVPLLPGGTQPFLLVPEGWHGDLRDLRATEGRYQFELAPTAQEQGGAFATLR